MKPKTQAKALALGGFFAFIALAFGRIDFNWFGFVYCGFTSLLGFFNWIELDKQSSQILKTGDKDGLD